MTDDLGSLRRVDQKLLETQNALKTADIRLMDLINQHKGLLTAKGSMYAAAAINTPAALTVGANDTVLTADSSQSVGVRWSTLSGISSFAEQVQDVVGAMVVGTSTIVWTYDDAANQLSAVVFDNSISNAKLRDSGALSVIGRSANSSGDPADISASAASDAVLRESGSVLGFGTIATGGIANDAVTNAKLRDSGALSVIGRSANSSGDPADISASAASDAVLRESGSVLGFGTIATGGIANDAVTNAKAADMAQATIKGRASGAGTGDPTDLTAAQVVTILLGADGSSSGLDADLLDGLNSTAFAILAGQSGGQTLKGGTASGDDLTLMSTNHATKGHILFGTSGYDEVNNRLGIATTSPNNSLELVGDWPGSYGQLVVKANASNWSGVTLYRGTTYGAYIAWDTSDDLLIQNHNAGSYGLLALNPSGGDVVVGGTSSDHEFEVQDQGASNYRMTMNVGHSGVNYLNSYSTAPGTLTAAPLTIVGSPVQFATDHIIIEVAKTPASASATGTAGSIAWNTTHLYVCTATDTWKRVAISTF